MFSSKNMHFTSTRAVTSERMENIAILRAHDFLESGNSHVGVHMSVWPWNHHDHLLIRKERKQINTIPCNQ